MIRTSVQYTDVTQEAVLQCWQWQWYMQQWVERHQIHAKCYWIPKGGKNSASDGIEEAFKEKQSLKRDSRRKCFQGRNSRQPRRHLETEATQQPGAGSCDWETGRCSNKDGLGSCWGNFDCQGENLQRSLIFRCPWGDLSTLSVWWDLIILSWMLFSSSWEEH